MTHHTTKTCRTCRRRSVNASKYGDPIGMTPPGNPRLSWPPLAGHLPPDVKAAARTLGVNENQIRRWQTYGLELHDADRHATRLGLVTALVWGDEYWAVGFHDCPIRPDLEAAA